MNDLRDEKCFKFIQKENHSETEKLEDFKQEIRCLKYKYEEMKKVAKEERRGRLLNLQRAERAEKAAESMAYHVNSGLISRPAAFSTFLPQILPVQSSSSTAFEEKASVESIKVPEYLRC